MFNSKLTHNERVSPRSNRTTTLNSTLDSTSATSISTLKRGRLRRGPNKSKNYREAYLSKQ